MDENNGNVEQQQQQQEDTAERALEKVNATATVADSTCPTDEGDAQVAVERAVKSSNNNNNDEDVDCTDTDVTVASANVSTTKSAENTQADDILDENRKEGLPVDEQLIDETCTVSVCNDQKKADDDVISTAGETIRLPQDVKPSEQLDLPKDAVVSEVTDSSETIVLSNTTTKTAQAELEADKLTPSSNAKTNASPTTSEAKALSTIDLLSLPIDSLHGIASFLSLSDWSSFGRVNLASKRIYTSVIRRVRLHGFKCATEIVTAWKLQQHADCKELAALYVTSGVPVYPRSLGHSYHTLLWRMDVEARALLPETNNAAAATTASTTSNSSNNESDASTESASNSVGVDPFYLDRLEFRMRNEYSPDVTYLEEKSLFYMNRRLAVAQAPSRFGTAAASNITINNGMGNNNQGNMIGPRAPRIPGAQQQVMEELLFSMHNQCKAGRQMSPNYSPPPKLPVCVHQHLLDQHLQGRLFVNDHDGDLVTPPISLSADFYHCNQSQLQQDGHNISASYNNNVAQTLSGSQSENITTLGPRLFPSVLLGEANEVANAGSDVGFGDTDGEQDSDNEIDVDVDVELEGLEADDILELRHNISSEDSDSMQLRTSSSMTSPPSLSPTRIHAIFNFTNVGAYTASLGTSPLVSSEIKTHLKSRFQTYQRRLESFLLNNDSNGFEDCMLDFWDEFFPRTSLIHYHDRHTAVPRISCLQKFLTRPCPKSLGVVQCEIERIKSSTKGKGVSMKGRFFPTYEYRLFIKNRPHSSSPESAAGSEQDDFIRRDTVLMTAKNRGRKHLDAVGARSVTPTNKKGANNYYLQMPQQVDVDVHFNSVNNLATPAKLNPNGASNESVLMSNDVGSPLLGRLQSNFIGTEFQIYTPRLRKRQSKKAHVFSSPSDDEYDYDSGMSSDNPVSSTRRLSRFGRRSMRRNAHPDMPLDCNMSDTSSVRSLPGHRRTKSCPPVQGTRTLRRVANTPDSLNSPQLDHVMTEEEDGVITYTANLLGSRPRIMDVCVPRISVDGIAGAQWRHYLETLDEPVDEARMLRCFRAVQQRLENHDQGIITNAVAATTAATAVGENQPNHDDASDHLSNIGHVDENYGLLALQNRPPWWNVELGSFVLNFGGRVSVASVKNFQLCERQDQDKILLQFGRIQGRHSFTMDFQYPLTAVQAFAIAISSLQSKISFG